MQRDAALAQREVERGRLVRPAAVVARRLADRRGALEQVELAEQGAQLAERRRAGEVEDRPRVPLRDVVELVVDDVLADSLLTAAAQVDDRRRAREVAVPAVAVLELVGLDADRELRKAVKRRHRVKPIANRI